MTNVYFKKENDIILNGTLWKEVENKLMPRASLANHQKHSAAPVRAGAAPPLGLASLDHAPASACPRQPPTGVPPSGLFIVESVSFAL